MGKRNFGIFKKVQSYFDKRMSWNYINSGFNSGYYNMQFDVDLTKKCNDGKKFLRLYRWSPFCISLGAHQSFDDINVEKANSDNLHVVKRPTGGKAILHAEELTYSVVLELDDGLTPKSVYSKVSRAIVSGLSKYHSTLSNVDLQTQQPDFKALLKKPEGKLCFATAAKNEITYYGRKLVGSAQRKMGNIILQHGSILCGPYHKKLINYLPENEMQFSNLDENTCDIQSILNEPVDYLKLSGCIRMGFESEFEIQFEKHANFTAPQINS
jgi:lipoate-protein ligase A